MQTTRDTLLHRTWTRDSYSISTDPSLIPIPSLNAVFATDLVYWANPLPPEIMLETLNNSLCFGVYENSSATPLIGFARCITDFTTFSYLTDVYVLPAYQGRGLGKWLVSCVGEVHDSMPYLRRSMLFTSDWGRSVPFYEGVLGMNVLNGEGRGGEETKAGGRERGPAIMGKIGRGFPEKLRNS